MAAITLTTLIDTSVVIWALNAEARIVERLRSVEGALVISAITLVELQGGVGRTSQDMPQAKARIDAYLELVEVLPFGVKEASAYGAIIADHGFSRPRVADRMIAAQAIVAGARLITINGDDFKSIAGLELEVWRSPV